MKKTNLKLNKASIFFFCLVAISSFLYSCINEKSIDPEEFSSHNTAQSLLSKYIVVENNRYKLNLSKTNAKKIGISSKDYEAFVLKKDNANQNIEIAEKDYPNSKIIICNPNHPIQSNSLTNENMVQNPTKSTKSGDSKTEVWGYRKELFFNGNILENFSFEHATVNHTYLYVQMASPSATGYQMYIIYAEVKDSYNRTFTVIPSGYDGQPIYYYYDPAMWGETKTIASFHFDLTSLTNGSTTPYYFDEAIPQFDGWVRRASSQDPTNHSAGSVHLY